MIHILDIFKFLMRDSEHGVLHMIWKLPKMLNIDTEAYVKRDRFTSICYAEM